jgi:hypothetical protein
MVNYKAQSLTNAGDSVMASESIYTINGSTGFDAALDEQIHCNFNAVPCI